MSTKQNNPIEILPQKFFSKNGKLISLNDFLKEGDWWTKKGKTRTVTILTHDAVKKIGAEAGVRLIKYEILTQPDCYNNYQYTMQCTVDYQNTAYIEIGESNRNNLGSKGRGNPANMAQKRAYDRAVLSAVGIIGLLSEEELDENNENNKVDTLTHDEKKGISILLNQILLAKTKKNMQEFGLKMKVEAKKYNEQQLEFLRAMYRKKMAELTATKF